MKNKEAIITITSVNCLQTPSDRFILKEEEFIKEDAEQIKTRSQALKIYLSQNVDGGFFLPFDLYLDRESNRRY